MKINNPEIAVDLGGDWNYKCQVEDRLLIVLENAGGLWWIKGWSYNPMQEEYGMLTGGRQLREMLLWLAGD